MQYNDHEEKLAIRAHDRQQNAQRSFPRVTKEKKLTLKCNENQSSWGSVEEVKNNKQTNHLKSTNNQRLPFSRVGAEMVYGHLV